MKKAVIILLSAGVLVTGFLILYPPADNEASRQDSKGWETKTDDQANVNIAVTPIDLSQQSEEWKFDVTMNTHSVELDQDMTQVAFLAGDGGKEYIPLKWEGSSGGHHREGILTFSPITPYPQRLTLKIDSIGGVSRSFSWTLIKE